MSHGMRARAPLSPGSREGQDVTSYNFVGRPRSSYKIVGDPGTPLVQGPRRCPAISWVSVEPPALEARWHRVCK